MTVDLSTQGLQLRHFLYTTQKAFSVKKVTSAQCWSHLSGYIFWLQYFKQQKFETKQDIQETNLVQIHGIVFS